MFLARWTKGLSNRTGQIILLSGMDWSGGRWGFPAAGDDASTFRAVAIAQIIFDYVVPGAANYSGVAVRTDGVFSSAVDVAFVHEI